MASCPSCGQEVGRDFAFCPSCAADLRVHPQRPPVPSERRQRMLAIAIAAVTILAVVAVVLLLPAQSVSTGLPIQTNSTVITSSVPAQTDSIMVGNYGISGVQSAGSPSKLYDLSIWVTNTGNVDMTSIEITVVAPPSGSPRSGPDCTFSQTVNATEQMEPGATVRVSCTGSPYVSGGEYTVTVVVQTDVNPGHASWNSQILAT